MLDVALQDKATFVMSIGNGTCTINPIGDIHGNHSLIADDVVRATIDGAHALSHPDKLDLSVRQATNPSVIIPESFLSKTKSSKSGKKMEEFETNTLLHIKEFQKSDSYEATSMFGDHDWTTALSKCATGDEDADLRLLLKGSPLTLQKG